MFALVLFCCSKAVCRADNNGVGAEFRVSVRVGAEFRVCAFGWRETYFIWEWLRSCLRVDG